MGELDNYTHVWWTGDTEINPQLRDIYDYALLKTLINRLGVDAKITNPMRFKDVNAKDRWSFSIEFNCQEDLNLFRLQGEYDPKYVELKLKEIPLSKEE